MLKIEKKCKFLNEIENIYWWLIALLIDYLLFYVPLKNILLIWICHFYRWRSYRWRAAKFRHNYVWRSGPLRREGSLWCHTYCYTGPRFSRSHSKDRPILYRISRRCRGPILNRILTGPHSIASYGTQRGAENVI
jgi:hypothetical protein